MSKKKTNEEFVNELKHINPFVVPLNAYSNSHTNMMFRCTICGKEWESKPYKVLHSTGKGCVHCSHKAAGKKRRKTNNEFTEELRKKNPNITLLSPYIKYKQKLKCQCTLCNNVWETTPDILLRGIGCPNCYHTATSFIEQFIYIAMSTVLGKKEVKSRDKSAIGKELDIYIPSLKLAIEYGSWYWHKSRIKKDFEKQRLCQEYNIKLLLIYDACKETNIDYGDNCYIFKYDLATEKSYKTINQLIVSILDSNKIDSSKLQSNWDSIEKQAYQKSRKLTTSGFIELVKTKNTHNIEILGEYKSSYSSILCRCRDCGFEWSPRPNNLLNENAGCPQCAGRISYTNQEFIEKVAEINPQFELLEPYSYSNMSILCRCKKCRYEWKAQASGLLKKRSGCPKCIGMVRYSNEEFIKKLHQINPNITPLEPYPKNNKVKILCSCNACGNQFAMRPNNLLSGQGCPKCALKKVGQKKIKSNETFISDLQSINPDIITLEPYLHSKSKLACKCKKCGYEWKATPNSLLHGYGCPQCGVRARALKNTKKVLCVETNTIYDSLKDAAAQSGFSNSAISMCCNGKHETIGGFHWKYIRP